MNESTYNKYKMKLEELDTIELISRIKNLQRERNFLMAASCFISFMIPWVALINNRFTFPIQMGSDEYFKYYPLILMLVASVITIFCACLCIKMGSKPIIPGIICCVVSSLVFVPQILMAFLFIDLKHKSDELEVLSEIPGYPDFKDNIIVEKLRLTLTKEEFAYQMERINQGKSFNALDALNKEITIKPTTDEPEDIQVDNEALEALENLKAVSAELSIDEVNEEVPLYDDEPDFDRPWIKKRYQKN